MTGYNNKKNYTKKNYTKKAYVKKPTYTPRVQRPRFDGRTMLISAYAEVEHTGAGARNMAYAVCCDPNGLYIKGTRATGNTLNDNGLKVQDGAGNYKSVTEKIPQLLFDREKSMWRLYRLNKITIKVTVDKACQDNPLTFLCDKGNSNPPSNYAEVMSQAHKSHIITDSRRQVQYGKVSNGTQEKEWVTSIEDADLNHIKVFQQLESAGTCIHRIEIMMNVSFKDSISPLALN